MYTKSVPEEFACQGPNDWRGLIQFCSSHGTLELGELFTWRNQLYVSLSS
jgi:hypothetical protein